MRKTCGAIVILACLATAAEAKELKTPDGCRAAKGAKAASDGYADKVIHEKTGIELLLIPAGSFTMAPKHPQASSTMGPPHTVTIARPFYLGKTTVTNGQYRKFVSAVKYDGEADTDSDYEMYLRHFRGKSLMSAEDDYPVVWVSWLNAKAFCKWAGLSLPSEAQWEYACRAGTTTPYYFGDDAKAFDQYGWNVNNSDYLTHPVAQKLPNAWGLYDMLGNVWEWCEDDYIYRYRGAPNDGSPFIDKKRRLVRVLRGGCWGSGTPVWCSSSSSRFYSAPTNASSEYGFRVMLPLDSSPK